MKPLCSAPSAPGESACFALGRVWAAARMPSTFGPNGGFAPQQLQSAYNLTEAQFAGGLGATVAVIDAYDDPNAESDMAAYRAHFNLPACTTANGCFTKVNQRGDRSPLPKPDVGWAMEISLDLDMVSAICPKCHILLVEADDPKCYDPSGGRDPNALMCSLYEAVNTAVRLGAKYISNSYGTPEHPIQNVLDEKYFNHPGVVITASTGDSGWAGPDNKGPSFPATSTYVTAAGGTTLIKDDSGRGWHETAWSGSGSGCSRFEARPAWQAVNTSCDRRAVADVSAIADPNPGVAIYDSYHPAGDVFQNNWAAMGGTSASSPIIASIHALAGTAGAKDYPASYPYKHQTAFNDITSGSNGTCPVPQICNAGIGWDGPTGLGTPTGVKSLANPASQVAAANPGDQWGKVDTEVRLRLKASGGTGKYMWTAFGLPLGLTIDPGTGEIRGTTRAVDRTRVTVTINDLAGSDDSVSFIWTVAGLERLTIHAPTGVTAIDRQTGGAPVAVSGGVAPYTFSAAGLPPGVSMNPQTGEITGSPATAGTYYVTVIVKDSGAAEKTSRWPQMAVTTFPWTVKIPPSAPARPATSGQVR
jgi:hypothetical protein